MGPGRKEKRKVMRKMRLALMWIALATISAESIAMSMNDIRREARVITDRMGYELGLSNRQYNDVYEINFDFLYQANEVLDDMIFGYDDAIDYYYYLLDMRNEDLMAEEAARNDLLLLFDGTRSLCNSITGKNSSGQEDNLILMEKQLLSDVLDRFARYMREEGDKMTPQEVIKVKKVVSELYKVASRLSKGNGYSRENRLDTSKYINKLLKQTNKEILRNETDK